MNEKTKTVSPPGVKNLTITIIYDNNPYKQGLETRWGFAAFITGTEKTILFDTGGSEFLLDNMEKSAIEPGSVDVVVLSHIHRDHTGGLDGFLDKNSNVTVYLPSVFPKKFKDNVQNYGAKIIEVNESLQICENVYSTGRLGKLIKEQSLIIKADKGLVVITGCAHPGILKIVNVAKDLTNNDISLVIGGFHLEWMTKSGIEKIISAFKNLGISYAGPCHCSGHKARSLFEKHFGGHYLNIGAGKVINLADLQ